MSDKEVNHYKDSIENLTNFSEPIKREEKYLKEIADKCREAYKNDVLDEEVLYDFLIDKNTTKGKEHNPNHDKCTVIKDSPRRGWEKQICKCMYYYNTGLYKECKDDKKCRLTPWKNVGNIPVKEYEYPSKYVMGGIGEIDLVLEYNNKIYGTEVKPPKSKEPICRMVAEILTYRVVDRKKEFEQFEPAIAVFKGSEQHSVIKELENNENEDWKEIKKHITVFVIEYEEKNGVNEFSIKPYEEI